MNPMRRTLLSAAALLPMAAAAQAALRLGLTPYYSPAALLAAYRPLREQLQRALAQPVEAFTARDFLGMAEGLQRAEFDIALVPAHLARIAVADWGWLPLAGTLTTVEMVLLVRGAGDVRQAADLRGRRVGMLPPLSLTTAVASQWIDAQGLGGTGGAEVVTVPSLNSGLLALERDELAAVVATGNQLPSLAGGPAAPRTLAVLGTVRDLVYVARPGTEAATLERWRGALLAFEPDPARPTAVDNTRLTSLSAADLEALEPYAAFLRRQLAAGR